MSDDTPRMTARIWADRSDDDLPHAHAGQFGIWWDDQRSGYTEYVREDLYEAERTRAEKAEAELASGSFYKESDIDDLQDRASLVSTPAARDVLAERRRQIEAEGWTPEHDDRHIRGEMAAAAACYIVPSRNRAVAQQFFWPRNWDSCWWKPAGPPDALTARRRDLVRGVAMGLAEIERLDRQSAAHPIQHFPENRTQKEISDENP